MKEKSVVVTHLVTPEDRDKLREIADYWGQSQAGWVRMKIRGEHKLITKEKKRS